MVDVIRDLMPSQSFSEMLKMLKKFVSFMSMTVSMLVVVGVVNVWVYGCKYAGGSGRGQCVGV